MGGIDGNGTDKYGFSALPSGYGREDGGFYAMGYFGAWWTNSNWDNNALYQSIGTQTWNTGTYNFFDKLNLYSIRCIKGNYVPGVSSSSSGGVGPSGCDVEHIDAHGSGCDISGYRTVVIGTQTWMAENLNCNVEGSKCYDNNVANCDKYGRLYDWETAKTVCPSGWHLPSDEEWDDLIDSIGDANTADRYLKATSGWCNNGNGEDTYGFSALPSGSYYYGDFGTVGKSGHWWSSSDYIHFQTMYYSNVGVGIVSGGDRAALYSVRCIKGSSSSTLRSSSSRVASSSSAAKPEGCDVEHIDNGGSGCDISGYKTVVIGTQNWMAENLNCDKSGSKCYGNNTANCDKYGRLYDWNIAKTVCPSGWHLPSDDEWKKLINYVESDNGCSSCAGRYLKATIGWCKYGAGSGKSGNGTDKYGFSALPGGYSYSDLRNLGVGEYGHWWTSYSDYSGIIRRDMRNDINEVDGAYESSDRFLSVRCVEN